jgi:DNA-binding NtrC family response regulator
LQKRVDKGMKLPIIPSMNDTSSSKALRIGLRPEELVDKSPIRGGSLNEVMSCGFFLSNAKYRWSKATSTRLVENASLEDLGLPEPSPPKPLKDQLREFERSKILDALSQTRGNITHAAQILKITPRHLRRLMKHYGIEKEETGRT